MPRFSLIGLLSTLALLCGVCLFSNSAHAEVECLTQKQTSIMELTDYMILRAMPSRCDSSGQCPGAALCKSGRCVKPNGDGVECDTSGECPGPEWCRNGRCGRP